MTICGPLIGSFCCDIDVVMGTFCRRDDNHWSPFTESTFHVPCLNYCTKHNAITKPWAASPPTHITCCTISVSFIQNRPELFPVVMLYIYIVIHIAYRSERRINLVNVIVQLFHVHMNFI